MSYGFTYKNHIKFGFDDSYSPFRGPNEGSWRVDYSPIQGKPLNFKEECFRAARLIYESTELPIQILYSGGSDSEVVVQSFHHQGIPFECIIIRFERGYNEHDISYAIKYCEQHSLKFKILDLDIEKFLDLGEAYEYAKLSNCCSPALLHHMWCIDQIDGFPIIGAGENHLVKKRKFSPVSEWESWDEEFFYCWHRFLIKRKRSGVPAFFQYTPELVASHLLSPKIQNLVACKYPEHFNSSEDVKLDMYRDYFDLNALPQHGYNGFEYLLELFANHHAYLINEFGNAIYKQPYVEMLNSIGVIDFED